MINLLALSTRTWSAARSQVPLVRKPLNRSSAHRSSPPMAPSTQSTPWHVGLTKLLNETCGIPGSGGYLTGVDLITIPVAFGAGCIAGGGLALYRGSRQWGRVSKGAGVFLCGATLAVPPYIRVMYAPFLFLSPPALLWAGLTGGIMGGGLKLMREQPTEAAAPVAAPPAEEQGEFDVFAPHHATLRGALGGFVFACGLYLALPGGVRVLMMYR